MKEIKKLALEAEYSPKIHQLFMIKNNDFEKSYEKFNFTKKDIPELTKLALDNRSEEIDYERYQEESDSLYYASSYAVILLGKLGVFEVIDILLEKMYLNMDSDSYHEAIIDYLEGIGIEAIDVIETHLLTIPKDKLTLFDGLHRIVKNNPQEKERVSIFLDKYLKETKDDKAHLGFAISLLLEFAGVKYIDTFREIFKKKEVNLLFAGDLEDIEIKLGIRKVRETEREKSFMDKIVEEFDSRENLLQQVRTEPKIGRNDPCPCASGKKYKKCCLNK
jgi:hypothetical protein